VAKPSLFVPENRYCNLYRYFNHLKKLKKSNQIIFVTAFLPYLSEKAVFSCHIESVKQNFNKKHAFEIEMYDR
jgi:hypothetical protein